jgi:hypothetical protein
LLFVAGVFVQRLGVNRSNDAVEVIGILLWSSPLALWTGIGGRSTKPRRRKDLMSIVWSGGVIGFVVLAAGIATLVSGGDVVVGGCLVGVCGLPFGLAVGALTSPSIEDSRDKARSRRHA